MRKKRSPKTFICKICGKPFSASNVAQYCKECGNKHEKERKMDWYRKNVNPNPRVKCTEPCCVCGGKFSGFFDGKPYCNKHWLRMYNNGTIDIIPRKITNEYIEHDDHVSVMCKNGAEILIDKDDVEKAKKHSWCISKTGYAVGNINGKTRKMHRYLLDVDDPNIVVDHKNHNTLDNRKENMRLCSARENAYNQRGNKNRKFPTGVTMTPSGKFRAYISVDNISIELGRYDRIEDAINARQEAELKYRGEYAYCLSQDSCM